MDSEAIAQFDNPDEDEGAEDYFVYKLPSSPDDIEEYVWALIEGAPEIQAQARRHLVTMGDSVAMVLLKGLKRSMEGQGNENLEQLFLALKELGEPTFQLLLRGLKSRKAGEVAALALGKIGDSRAVEPLLEALATGKPEISAMAASALSFIGDSRAIEPLTKAFNGNLRGRNTAFALAKLKVFEPLYPVLQDTDSLDRYNIIQALKFYGDQSVLLYVQQLPNKDAYLNELANTLKTRLATELNKEEK